MTTPEYESFIRDLDRHDSFIVDDELLIGSTLDDDELALMILNVCKQSSSSKG